MLVEKQKVVEYIPQKPPFVMVGCLVEANSSNGVTNFEIVESNLFCSEGLFQEPGLVENIAQSAALHDGYTNINSGRSVKRGFIGAVKKLSINFLPGKGAILKTVITVLHNFMNATVIDGKIWVNGNLAASCEMTIFTDQEK